MTDLFDKLLSLTSVYALNFLWALVIFFVGKKLLFFLTRFLKTILSKSSVDETIAKFLVNVANTLGFVIIVIVALNRLGVETSSFVALLGAIGLAIGLAFKDTFSNIGAGVLLILFRTFKVGDSIDAAGVSGIVEEINLFSIVLRTGDNKQIIVPNSGVIGKNIINFSAKPERRVDFIFGIDYGANIKEVKDILLEIIANDEKVLKDPPPFVGVNELGDHSVNIALRVWTKNSDYSQVYFETLEKVKITFDERKINIPYNQMDIRIIK